MVATHSSNTLVPGVSHDRATHPPCFYARCHYALTTCCGAETQAYNPQTHRASGTRRGAPRDARWWVLGQRAAVPNGSERHRLSGGNQLTFVAWLSAVAKRVIVVAISHRSWCSSCKTDAAILRVLQTQRAAVPNGSERHRLSGGNQLPFCGLVERRRKPGDCGGHLAS